MDRANLFSITHYASRRDVIRDFPTFIKSSKEEIGNRFAISDKTWIREG